MTSVARPFDVAGGITTRTSPSLSDLVGMNDGFGPQDTRRGRIFLKSHCPQTVEEEIGRFRAERVLEIGGSGRLLQDGRRQGFSRRSRASSLSRKIKIGNIGRGDAERPSNSVRRANLKMGDEKILKSTIKPYAEAR